MSMKDELVFSYSRARAIEDGVLFDVSETARRIGLRYPTAMTASVWADYVRVPEGVEGQDEAHRLWDILFMCCCDFLRPTDNGTEVLFQVLVRNDSHRATRVTLRAVISAGDELEPVITIMLLDEN
jgi:hypothetical protein